MDAEADTSDELVTEMDNNVDSGEQKQSCDKDEIEALPTVGVALASRLCDAGYDSVEAITDASVEDLTELDRLGERSAVALRLAAGASPSSFETNLHSIFGELEDLPAISENRAEALRDAGFDSPTELQALSDEELASVASVDTMTAQNVKRIGALLESADPAIEGVSLSELEREVSDRQRKYQERTATKLFNRFHSELGLGTGAIQFAVQTLKHAIEDDFLLRWSFDETVCASMVIASRSTGDPRTMDEVGAIGGIDAKSLGRIVPALTSTLGLEVGTGNPEDFVERYVSEIETLRSNDPSVLVIDKDNVPEPGEEDVVSRLTDRACELLASRPEENTGTSYQPSIVATGAVYAAYLLEAIPVSQPAFASTFDTNRVSIREHGNRLMESAGYEPGAHRYQKAARRSDGDGFDVDDVSDTGANDEHNSMDEDAGTNDSVQTGGERDSE